MTADVEKKLQKKAASLIARKAYSRGEMRLKLMKIADRAMVDAVLDRLEQLKLLNDADYAYNFAFYRANREGWGPEKIKNALLCRHVQSSDIEKALDRIRILVGNDYGLSDYLKRYSAKRGLPVDTEGVRNFIKHLLRRGFCRNSILDALHRVLPSEIMKYFGTGD